MASPTSLPTPVANQQAGALADISAAWAAVNALTSQVGRDGSGSPEGVVTAPVGTLYRDTSGGDLYIKATGSGNTGWTEVAGGGGGSTPDTGWVAGTRHSSWDAPGSAPYFDFRRIGSIVYTRVHVTPGSAINGSSKGGSNWTLGTIPTGYRPGDYSVRGVANFVGSTTVGQIHTLSDVSLLQMYCGWSGNWAAGTDEVFAGGSWITDNTWPA